MTPGPAGGRAGRATFSTRLGLLAMMIGAAVGLGNVWRFPYMVGEYGGSAFVLVYLAWAVIVGVPAVATEWALGRHTKRGTVGVFERAGLPGGRWVGWFFFCTVTAATAYYSNAIGWVIYHGVTELLTPLGLPLEGASILPPEEGFDRTSLLLQLSFTTLVVGASVTVLRRGVRRGIELASRILTPALFLSLLVLIVRSTTLDGASEGLQWLFLRFDLGAVNGRVALAALSQLVFSLALGGTFMVIYGSYLPEDEPLKANAVWTVAGDTAAGLLAGLAIFPAVFALGMEPASGPRLIFSTLPEVFARIPVGWAFGALFFLTLAGAAFLSAVAAFEVLVAGLTDNTGRTREQAIWIISGAVLVLAIPPMVNMRVFVPWDLTFGSGMQTLGALVAALTAGWAFGRARLLEEISGPEPTLSDRLLVTWVRFGVPGAMLTVAVWWLVTDVLGIVGSV